MVSVPFTLVVLVGAALLTPAAAQAGTPSATMALRSMVFPTGAAVPDGLPGSVHVSGGSLVILTAPQYLYEPPVPPATSGSVYEFMFWNAHATLISTEKAAFLAPSAGLLFRVTAWYLPIGGGGCAASPCPPSAVTTWAFSLTTNKVLSGTPIDTVSPSSAWTFPSTSVLTATAVTIGAAAYLGAHSPLAGTVFSSWFVFGGGGATASGLSLNVPAGQSPYAIAFYKQYVGGKTISPCAPVPC